MKTICTNQKKMFMVQIGIKVMHKLNHKRHTHRFIVTHTWGGVHHFPPYNIIHGSWNYIEMAKKFKFIKL